MYSRFTRCRLTASFLSLYILHVVLALAAPDNSSSWFTGGKTETLRCYAEMETSLRNALQIDLSNSSAAAVIFGILPALTGWLGLKASEYALLCRSSLIAAMMIGFTGFGCRPLSYTPELGEHLDLARLLKELDDSQTLQEYQEAKEMYRMRCNQIQHQVRLLLNPKPNHGFRWRWALLFFSVLGTGAVIGWMAYFDVRTYKTLSCRQKGLSAVWLVGNLLLTWIWGLVVRLRTKTVVPAYENDPKQIFPTVYVVLGPGLGRFSVVSNTASLFLMIYGTGFWSSLILVNLREGFQLVFVTAFAVLLSTWIASLFLDLAGSHVCYIAVSQEEVKRAQEIVNEALKATAT